MTKDEALKTALKALERVNTVDDDCDILTPSLADAVVEAIDFIKETLAQPAQKPVAWRSKEMYSPDVGSWFEYYDEFRQCSYLYLNDLTPLYTTPPQRKPLTDEEIILIVADCATSHQHTDIHFARAIEAAVWEKQK